jgi:hypothetical protein
MLFIRLSSSLKVVKYIDALPTGFGLVAIAGVFISSGPNTGYWSPGNIGLAMMYAGAGVALLMGLVSGTIAKQQQSIRPIHILNISWAVLFSLFFAWGAYVALTWGNFLGR